MDLFEPKIFPFMHSYQCGLHTYWHYNGAKCHFRQPDFHDSMDASFGEEHHTSNQEVEVRDPLVP